jgi:hypothetical protein
MLGQLPPICYREIPGSELRPWTLPEIRQRLAEAATTLRRMPMPKHGKPADFQVSWPDVVYDWLAFGWYPSRTPRIPPTPIEISRLDETLNWLHLLTRDQRVILWARANNWPGKQIEPSTARTRRTRTTRATLRNILHDGNRILNHLNQPTTPVINLTTYTQPKRSAAR